MSLTREQLALIAKAQAPTKVARAVHNRTMSARKGYVKPLPRCPLTPKASTSELARLIKGTESSERRNVCQTDARPKAALADRRIMRDVANMSQEDILYTVPEGAQMVDLFIEFLRVRKLRADREAATALEGRLNARQYRSLTRALSRGELGRVSEILETALNSNQIKL